MSLVFQDILFFCFYWTGQLNQTGQYRMKKGEKYHKCFTTMFFLLLVTHKAELIISPRWHEYIPVLSLHSRNTIYFPRADEQRARAAVLKDLKTESGLHPVLYHPLLRRASHQSTQPHFPSQQVDGRAVYLSFLFHKMLTHCLEHLCSSREEISDQVCLKGPRLWRGIREEMKCASRQKH